jgi:hypothetical protein
MPWLLSKSLPSLASLCEAARGHHSLPRRRPPPPPFPTPAVTGGGHPTANGGGGHPPFSFSFYAQGPLLLFKPGSIRSAGWFKKSRPRSRCGRFCGGVPAWTAALGRSSIDARRFFNCACPWRQGTRLRWSRRWWSGTHRGSVARSARRTKVTWY